MDLSRTATRRLIAAQGAGIVLSALAAAPSNAESPLSYQFANASVLTAYGQINPAYLGYDDGEHSQGYAPVGNANSTPRFGARYQADLDGGWSMLGVAEAGYMPRASNKISQLDGEATDWAFTRSNIRKIEVMFGNDDYGRVWLGQGSMASDTIAEIDKSGTDVIGYSNVADVAGGFFWRQTNGDLSDTTIKDSEKNLDGNRLLRIRYDTPSFSGFTLSGAYGNDWVNEAPDDLYGDVAVRYAGTLGGFDTEAGLGYNWIMPDEGGDSEYWSGSVSALHAATGLNVTLAGGSKIDEDGEYVYTKLGWKANFWAVGSTNFAVDYYDGNGFADSTSISDSESVTYSVMAVQSVKDYNVDVYAIYRVYTYDDNRADYQDGAAVMTGLRWKF